MQARERHILGGIADEIEAYRAGRQSMFELLSHSWSIFEAAEVRDPDDQKRFLDVYYALSTADDALQPWMPAEVLGSDEDVQTALATFASWIAALRDDHPADIRPNG